MVPNSPQASHTTTILFFLLILIAFFPGVFHYLWTLPLSLIFSSTPAFNSGGSDPTADIRMGSWFQKQFTLPSKSRGSYLITDHVVSSLPELKQYKVGLLHLFIQHTSCALSLNENWDDDGADDMPAHIKSALVGASVTIPIRDGKLATGTWQGIWYLEFRAMKHQRRVVATIQGEKA
ncbi:hypothetical protein KVR01_004430 [Diaporthe batatas]|uniref:uncharacterized protein n=1 Tax=Diaporthe batatas TaxID=748121 RepID=UPI001D04CE3A|nr:uncharacterized protein KVR01_004430 [Diaporthe batatas]KAG8165878.1 hypothetical protein KVR01_004430 [Diaporthe batatas]